MGITTTSTIAVLKPSLISFISSFMFPLSSLLLSKYSKQGGFLIQCIAFFFLVFYFLFLLCWSFYSGLEQASEALHFSFHCCLL